ncbi:MAG: DUF1844 domain-containing protein [Elusimicrobiota bacterium]
MNDNNVDLNFFNIVISLSQAAMLGMGKIAHPESGEVSVNLDIAKINIDILQMLKDKTVGNLTKKEAEVLNETLTNLQLTYVDEVKKQGLSGKKPDDSEGSSQEKTEETPENSSVNTSENA